VAWRCYQQLRVGLPRRIGERPIDRAEGHRILSQLPDPPRSPASAAPSKPGSSRCSHFDTDGVSNGGTEAINLIIEKVRRLAHGFRDFSHYRLRILLAASGNRAYRSQPNHA
jgi:transposase